MSLKQDIYRTYVRRCVVRMMLLGEPANCVPSSSFYGWSTSGGWFVGGWCGWWLLMVWKVQHVSAKAYIYTYIYIIQLWDNGIKLILYWADISNCFMWLVIAGDTSTSMGMSSYHFMMVSRTAGHQANRFEYIVECVCTFAAICFCWVK